MLNYGAGPVRNNSRDVLSYAGTLTFDFSPVSLRLAGTFSDLRQDLINNAESRNWTPILSLFNPRVGERDINVTEVLVPKLHMSFPRKFFMKSAWRILSGRSGRL
jgi:hypothetical protein